MVITVRLLCIGRGDACRKYDLLDFCSGTPSSKPLLFMLAIMFPLTIGIQAIVMVQPSTYCY